MNILSSTNHFKSITFFLRKEKYILIFKELFVLTQLKSMGSKTILDLKKKLKKFKWQGKNAYSVQNTNTSLSSIYISIHEAMGH